MRRTARSKRSNSPERAPGVGGYDQVKVTGTVSLGGADLDLALLGGFTPSIGNSFTIVDNDGADAVSGTFPASPRAPSSSSTSGR